MVRQELSRHSLLHKSNNTIVNNSTEILTKRNIDNNYEMKLPYNDKKIKRMTAKFDQNILKLNNEPNEEAAQNTDDEESGPDVHHPVPRPYLRGQDVLHRDSLLRVQQRHQRALPLQPQRGQRH